MAGCVSPAREFHEVDRLSAFFDLINQDPVVTQVKLIAEPWDVGPGGYQVGGFPPLWTEWNGKYRDTVRDFRRDESASIAEFASRFTGSSDLYEADGRRPHASTNFDTAHDGFISAAVAISVVALVGALSVLVLVVGGLLLVAVVGRALRR